MKIVDTPAVRIAYEEHGPADGPPVVLLHGFPFDVRADTVGEASCLFFYSFNGNVMTISFLEDVSS